MTIDSPVDALLGFVEQLPTTMKDAVLARCCMAFGRLQRVPRQDLFATFRAILVSRDAGEAPYACAQMIAVLELALCSPEARLPREWCDAPAARGLTNIDPGSPLLEKHWRAAQDEFAELRNTVLHTQSLRTMLLRNPPRQPDSYERQRDDLGRAE